MNSSAQQFMDLSYQQQGIVSMAAAFSPDTTSPPFYYRSPIDSEGNIIDTVWAEWLKEDVTSMVPAYLDKLSMLKAIQFDCGTGDHPPYKEARDFSQELDKYQIEHVFLEYTGEHSDKIGQRIDEYLLPFFSSNLEHSTTITSLREKDIEPVKVYPNPVSDLLTVRNNGAEIQSLAIRTITGKEVLFLNPGNDSQVLDLTSLQTGIYILTVGTQETSSSVRIVKK